MGTRQEGGGYHLLKKSIGLEVLTTDADEEGRRVSITVTYGTTSFRFTNVYAPNSPIINYFQELITWFSHNLHTQHIVGGDFNTTIDEGEDGTGHSRQKRRDTHTRQCKPSYPLQTFTDSMNLADIWRQFNPLGREYTHNSHPHSSFSRIDYISATPDSFQLINDAQIHEIEVSDHAPVTIDIKDARPRATHINWKFPTHLASQTDFKNFLTKEWRDYRQLNEQHASNPILFWEAGKAVMRGSIISYVSSYKKEKREKFIKASKHLREVQHRH